jgi:glucose/arabinose dehydrogenase
MRPRRIASAIAILVTILVSVLVIPLQSILVGVYASTSPPSPILRDPNLTIQTVVSRIEYPTGMAFLGPDDILVIGKNTGKVTRIINGKILQEPLLDVNVANQVERGLLGIAVAKNDIADKTYVFLYYTESEKQNDDGGDYGDGNGDGGEPVGNRLYRYDLDLLNNKLVNPKLLLDLPYKPGPAHNGGVVKIGPDNNVYVVVGNLYTNVFNEGGETTLAQNVDDGKQPDGRGGILRVTQDGQIVNDIRAASSAGEGEDNTVEVEEGEGILGDERPLDMYYAYGIRNSFGMDFDPIIGNLWQTENGGYDEINLVEPGFNSGFNHITGSASRSDRFDPDDLTDFDGRGKYSDPELDLGQHIAPTAITFLHSNKLGKQYENDIFVGNTGGRIFHFNLSEDRTKLLLEGPLADKIADDLEELEEGKIIFGEYFGVITDLEVGPDG